MSLAWESFVHFAQECDAAVAPCEWCGHAGHVKAYCADWLAYQVRTQNSNPLQGLQPATPKLPQPELRTLAQAKTLAIFLFGIFCGILFRMVAEKFGK